MIIPVLTAIAGPWEASLVATVESARTGVVVVRRCVDLADLLACAASGRAQAVLLGADLHRLNRDALAQLRAAGVAVVGVHEESDGEQAARLDALGVGETVPADATAAAIRAAVEAALHRLASSPSSAPRVVAHPARDVPRPRAAADETAGTSADEPGSGQLVAVWGPAGSPGRTTVAVTLAAELAALGHQTLLVDADTYAASIAQTVGVLDEAPGIAAACRAASSGTLDTPMLARLAPVVAPRLRVLTGITRASRWPEVSGPALGAIFPLARKVATWTVVDCGFSLEVDEELTFDSAAPRRNAATLVTLEHADVVLAVGAADPVGLQRLVRGLGDVRDAAPAGDLRVVVTKVRASAVGASPSRRISEALGRYAGVEDAVLVPDDRSACDAALLAGRTLTEAAASSPARRALAQLAVGLVEQRQARPIGRHGTLRRRRRPVEVSSMPLRTPIGRGRQGRMAG